jgi:hypothetical protein
VGNNFSFWLLRRMTTELIFSFKEKKSDQLIKKTFHNYGVYNYLCCRLLRVSLSKPCGIACLLRFSSIVSTFLGELGGERSSLLLKLVEESLTSSF